MSHKKRAWTCTTNTKLTGKKHFRSGAPLKISQAQALARAASLSFSFTHTHTHTHPISCSLSLSLSLSRAHTFTHTPLSSIVFNPKCAWKSGGV